MAAEMTMYERVGGAAFFQALVERFYDGVEQDPLLRPMYEEDLGPARERLSLFLGQYFGGPRAYEELRGDPRLRMRHLRFRLDEAARDAWLSHMAAALAAADCGEQERSALWDYFVQAANFFMNTGLSISGN